MDNAQTHYEVLGIDRHASRATIRQAYRQLAQKYHPDRYGRSREKAERIMVRLNLAYAELSDTKRRTQYDATLPERVQPEPTRDTWQELCEQHPHVAAAHANLSEISLSLADAYRKRMLAQSNPATALSIGDQMGHIFTLGHSLIFGT